MNWHQRIEAARERGEFTAEDKALAFDYTTCACGEIDPRIPRMPSGEPADEGLANLGADFYADVFVNRFEDASTSLQLIEQRAAAILSELPINEVVTAGR